MQHLAIHRQGCSSRKGFTLIELLVCIGIVAILLSIILPAVQSTRAVAAKTICTNHLRQQSVATIAYEELHGHYPRGAARGELLPFLGEQVLYDEAVEYLEENFDNVTFGLLPYKAFDWVICPSDPAPIGYPDADGRTLHHTSYLWNGGNGERPWNGFFISIHPRYKGREFGAAAITDGLSQTAMYSEVLHMQFQNTSRLRVIWNVPRNDGEEMNDWLNRCEALPAAPADYGYTKGSLGLGWLWTQSSFHYTGYSHMLSPNRPSCLSSTRGAGGRVQTASSQHVGGANVAYGDGHVDFVNQSIDRAVWSEQGSRGMFPAF